MWPRRIRLGHIDGGVGRLLGLLDGAAAWNKKNAIKSAAKTSVLELFAGEF